jgi:outer membrane translocation and assembly module TamA
MKKYILLVIGLVLIIGGLSTREWLIREEISIRKTNLKEQASLSIQNAQSHDRVRYFSTSAVVYERYLEPIIQEANRLLWPTSRADLLADWKREIHFYLDDLSNTRLSALSSESEKEIQRLHQEVKPSVKRLYDILKASENSPSLSCAQTVRSEMQSISEAGQKRDQEMLTAMKIEGLNQLKHLDKAVKGMTNAQLGNFLKSGRFIREIEAPVLDFALQIKQEELRKAAWEEFERKVLSALSKKGASIADVKDRSLRAKKEIAKLMESMTEAKNLESELPTSEQAESNIPAPLPLVEEPSQLIDPTNPGASTENDGPAN